MGDAAKKIKDFTSGYLAGLAGMPLAVVPMHDGGNTGEIVACLYNGVELPPLPYWDAEKYPYAIIYTNSNAQQYVFDCQDTPYTVSDNGTTIPENDEYTKRVVDGVWVDYASHFLGTVIWSNENVYYSTSGALFLEESDPEPVYAEADIDNKAIMLGCRLGYIIRSQMGKGQVEIPDGVLISSDGYILTDCNGVYLIAKEDA